MMTARDAKSLQQLDPESMTISDHLAQLPASLVAGAERLRAAAPGARAFASIYQTTKLQTVSMAAFAVLLSRYGLRAELEAIDGQVTVRLSRGEDSKVNT